jgi:hypothetical protein
LHSDYDPSTGTFSSTGDMTFRRYRHAAISLPNGKILIAGGLSFPIRGDDGIATAELYDPLTETFSVAGTMITSQFAPTTSLVPQW